MWNARLFFVACLARFARKAALFTAGKLSAHVDRVFGLNDAAQAFNYSAGPGEGGVGEHIGKISITTA